MPHEFCGPCGYLHITPVDAACVRQPPSLRRSTRANKAIDKAEEGILVKSEKAVESSETLQVSVESESGISDDERALLEKLKCLEKGKKKVAESKSSRGRDIENVD